jgi:WD40 repeat protein
LTHSLKALGFEPLNQKCDILVSKLAFKSNLYRYTAAVEPTRLLSGGADGTVIIWSVGQWDRLKTLKAHRGGGGQYSLNPADP